MPTMAEVRDKYPQYGDMSDDELAGALHKKFYADMPEDQFRQKIGLAAAKPTPPEPSMTDKALGVGEAGLKLASGAIGSLAGGLSAGGTIIANTARNAVGLPDAGDPKANMEKVQSDLTYQPRTAQGKSYSAAVEKPFERVEQFAEDTGAKVTEKTGSPLAGTVVRMLPDVAMAALPGAPKALKSGARTAVDAVRPVAARIAARGEEAAAVRAAEEAPKQAKIAQARTIGLKIPPSEATGAPVGRVLEGVSGKVQTEMAFSRDNAKVVNRTINKDIGLTERQSATPANIERLKQKQFAVYDRVRKAGKIASDDAYREELNAVRERTAQEELDYPEDTNELIDKEIKKFDRPSADAGSMLSKIKSLRDRASRNMQSPDAEKFELGLAQKKIATAMENLIDRQVADKSLIADFRKARTQLAKIYNAEDALGPNGNYSAAVLARMQKRGVPLSGGLKTIAETYQEFPKVMRYVDNLGGHAPFSALDYLVGGVEAVAHPAATARIVGALAGRPLARGIIRSKPYQKAAIKPRETRPTLTTRAARRIAGPTLNSLDEEAPKRLTLDDQ